MNARLIIALALGLSAAACTSDSKPAAPADHVMPAAVSQPAASGLTRVDDVSQVCMVTNQYMGVAQIPIEVEGKTYFGCCEMCKARLANEPETRSAKDPVTGEAVDKATAVIARGPTGKILYFASADTMARYRVN
jgi:YHS domain-containing protein